MKTCPVAFVNVVNIFFALSIMPMGAAAGPREDVAEIAKLIDANYFDAKLAADIAGDLKKDAASGSFDRYTDRNDLAAALTTRLRPLDGHFNVTWRPQTKPQTNKEPADKGAPPRVDFSAVEKRTNYGFRRVERLPGNIAYIDLAFVADIDFKDANSMSRRVADSAIGLVRGADAVILDLRLNGGGAPSMVGYLVSAFVKPDADVYNTFHSRTGTESERPGIFYPQPLLDVPLYILTSARTGSAAEAIAFTLQTCGRAIVVGERSAGAANPGEPFVTPQGFAIFISTGSPRNPINGRNWEGDGVQPNTLTTASQALQRAQELALDNAAANASDDFAKTDARWSLEALRGKTQPYQPKNLADYIGSYALMQIEEVAGTLKVRNGRREPVSLVPLTADVFYPEGDPSRRFYFDREKQRVAALRIRTAAGDEQRLNRVSQ